MKGVGTKKKPDQLQVQLEYSGAMMPTIYLPFIFKLNVNLTKIGRYISFKFKYTKAVFLPKYFVYIILKI